MVPIAMERPLRKNSNSWSLQPTDKYPCTQQTTQKLDMVPSKGSVQPD